jgi:NADPH:quinone reductase-like Zn-dependent oxidoreductase
MKKFVSGHSTLSNMDPNSLTNKAARLIRLYLSAGKRVVQEISGTHLAFTSAALLLVAGVVYYSQNRIPVDSDKQRRLRILVTGGTKGFGAALVQQFIQLGDDVIIASRSAKTVDRSRQVWDNQKIITMQCDMSRPDQVEELGFQIIDKFGSLDLW